MSRAMQQALKITRSIADEALYRASAASSSSTVGQIIAVGTGTFDDGVMTVTGISGIQTTDVVFFSLKDPNDTSVLGTPQVVSQTAGVGFTADSIDASGGSTPSDDSIWNWMVVRPPA
jgi:hypothetical protein